MDFENYDMKLRRSLLKQKKWNGRCITELSYQIIWNNLKENTMGLRKIKHRNWKI